MATSSTTKTPTLACPPWCTTRPENHSWALDDRGPMQCHDGPSWGPFGRQIHAGGDQWVDGSIDVSLRLDLQDPTEDIDAHTARALAADLIAAAEWLEAQS